MTECDRDGPPRTHGGWDPSGPPHEATFTEGQTAGARGRAPTQRETGERREGGTGGEGEGRSGRLYKLSQDVGNAGTAN